MRAIQLDDAFTIIYESRRNDTEWRLTVCNNMDANRFIFIKILS